MTVSNYSTSILYYSVELNGFQDYLLNILPQEHTYLETISSPAVDSNSIKLFLAFVKGCSFYVQRRDYIKAQYKLHMYNE